MLKPQPTGNLPFRPVLTDLGLAKLLEGGVMTSDGVSMGTPSYMSPEQALGKPTLPQSDVYSLGILLYELAVGRLPFPIKSLTEAIRFHTVEKPPAPHTLRRIYRLKSNESSSRRLRKIPPTASQQPVN